MAKKNLPIKFFEKRQKDEQATEGAGGGKLPNWVIQDRSALTERSVAVRKVLSEVGKGIERKTKRKSFIPSVVRLKVHQDAIAKSYRKDIGKLFNVGKMNVIGFNGDDEMLIKIDNAADLEKIATNFSKVETNVFGQHTAIGISAINEIEEFKAHVEATAEEHEILKVKLFNYGDYDLNRIVNKAFQSYCAERNIVFEKTVYSGDLNIYRINKVTADGLDALKDFDGVQLITDMPSYDVTLDEVTEENVIPIKLPEKDREYPIVGVLDSGISDIPHLKPWLVKESITYYDKADVNKAHGTFVSGVLLYGDELENKDYVGSDGCKLFETLVIPDITKQTIYEDELVEQIRDAISRHEHIKIWNLSLGTNREADLYEFSDFAKALDEMQEHHNVLICKSAGNCNNYVHDAPRSRITKSADTVRGLVVGSIAHAKGEFDISDEHNPSPFTRVGPGPANLIKPDVVHIGGNAGKNGRRVVMNPVKSFTPSGGIAKNIGTSFSTPRVTALAAGLSFKLKEEFNPLLIKALIVHSAKYPENLKMDIADKIKMTGFGLPSTMDDVLFNAPNEITLILQDTLEKGSFINILDFPFPKSMIDEDGYYYGEVTLTLVTSPILEVSQGAEYCQSNMDVMFGSYDTKKERDTSLSHIKNPIGPDGNQNLLNESIYSKRITKNPDNPFAKERVLIAYGKKYQPVKKWVVKLDELRDANREHFLKAPKNWYLKLTGLFRDYTETKCELQNIDPSQEFCLIITIKDTKKRGNIYNEVTQMLDQFSFIHSNVKIREDVKVRLKS